MENPKVKGVMVDAAEFPELADHYQVMAVPKTVIRGRQPVMFEGKLPESGFLRYLQDALK